MQRALVRHACLSNIDSRILLLAPMTDTTVSIYAVFWGGREGYQSLLNTDVKRELDHMAAFFRMAAGKWLEKVH